MGIDEGLCLPKMTLSLTLCWIKKWDLVYRTKLRNLKGFLVFFFGCVGLFVFFFSKNIC